MRTGMTSRPLLVAGALVIGVTFSMMPAVTAAMAADAGPKWRAELSPPGCAGETESWLPGALQIEDRAQTTPAIDAGQETLRATTSHDCALV